MGELMSELSALRGELSTLSKKVDDLAAELNSDLAALVLRTHWPAEDSKFQ